MEACGQRSLTRRMNARGSCEPNCPEIASRISKRLAAMSHRPNWPEAVGPQRRKLGESICQSLQKRFNLVKGASR
jgi:hypothetical protein